MRRAPSIDALIPSFSLLWWLYWEISPKDCSATNISRLTKIWEEEYEEWQDRDLSSKKYIYFWVDGIYFNIKLSSDRPCLLVIIEALLMEQRNGRDLQRRKRK